MDSINQKLKGAIYFMTYKKVRVEYTQVFYKLVKEVKLGLKKFHLMAKHPFGILLKFSLVAL